MKIKIVEPGWAGYTGYFGRVEFVDGISVEDVSKADAASLAALVAIEDEDGCNPSDSQRIVDSTYVEAKVEAVVEVVVQTPVEAVVHTKESLEAIADKDGIKGIRALTDPLGIKGNSIAELITKVLASQADAK